MLTRREVIAGGVVGSLATSPAAAEAVAQDQNYGPELREIRSSISTATSSIARSLDGPSLAHGPVPKLRALMEQFLRTNNKWPDYIDIGTAIFYDMYDWHVRNRQQLVITRGVDNRYTMQFMFTTLVLRQESEASFIGHAYDKA